MPRIAIEVDATVGTTIKRDDQPTELTDVQIEAHGDVGWPVGHGYVTDTLADDGRPLEALVLMGEPARPGDDVAAWPVAVLHLATKKGQPVEEVLCVAEAACFTDLVDLSDLPRWHAEPDVWAEALSRLAPGTEYRVAGYGPVREADSLLSSAHHAYLRMTGCMD